MNATRWGRVLRLALAPVYVTALMLAGFGAFAVGVGGVINGDWGLALLGLAGVALFYLLFVPKGTTPTEAAAEVALRRYREQGGSGKGEAAYCECTHTRASHTGPELFCAVPWCDCETYTA